MIYYIIFVFLNYEGDSETGNYWSYLFFSLGDERYITFNVSFSVYGFSSNLKETRNHRVKDATLNSG